MVRTLFILGILLLGLILGIVAEVDSWNEREPVFERGVIVGAAFIISGVLAVAVYLLWPRPNSD